MLQLWRKKLSIEKIFNNNNIKKREKKKSLRRKIRRSITKSVCDFIVYMIFFGEESIFYTGIINPDRFKPTRRRCLDGGGWLLENNNNNKSFRRFYFFFLIPSRARITDCSFLPNPPDDQHRSDRWRWLAWQPPSSLGREQLTLIFSFKKENVG